MNWLWMCYTDTHTHANTDTNTNTGTNTHRHRQDKDKDTDRHQYRRRHAYTTISSTKCVPTSCAFQCAEHIVHMPGQTCGTHDALRRGGVVWCGCGMGLETHLGRCSPPTSSAPRQVSSAASGRARLLDHCAPTARARIAPVCWACRGAGLDRQRSPGVRGQREALQRHSEHAKNTPCKQ